MKKQPICNDPAPVVGERKWRHLRNKHPRFVYESFSLNRRGEALRLQFRFRLEPDIEFAPETVIERLGERVDWHRVESLPQAALENLAFHLGLIEMLSYWKAACSPEIVVRAGALDAAQIAWWMDLLQHGMGEFFCMNRINFRQPDFVRILAVGEEQVPRGGLNAVARDDSQRDLVLASGGKDSVVTLEVLRAAGRAFDCLLLNPTEAAKAVARQAGCTAPIVVRRSIDPRLLELNAAGYLNGHTPFSALLAFLGVTVAALGGYPRVIVSNERSAEEAAVEYLGEPINHQYSKTLRFERAFRQYSQKYLVPGVEYFSLLRPLYELQIARLFADSPAYFPLFRSCNRGMKDNTWCGRCPKCLFVYAALYPFLEREQMLSIFGQDLFAGEGAGQILQALLGLDANKPFECVGTKEETLAAIYLCAQKYRGQGIELPPALRAIEETVLSTRSDLPQLAQRVLTAWTDEHHLPPELVEIIRRLRR
ncbi:MAG: hypothetical protein HYS38_07855 [Acidobacteria bacterium]|nr:hypothetical protein [Acidobacteriota bacterium]